MPTMYQGQQKMQPEWKAQPLVRWHAYHWIAWAGEPYTPIAEDDLVVAFGVAAR